MLSFSLFRGVRKFESCGSFCGFYWADEALMAEAVAVALSHNACGVFVVPPVDLGGLVGSAVQSKDKVVSPWRMKLMSASHILRMDVPGGITVVFASFNFLGKVKAVRPENVIQIIEAPHLSCPDGRVGCVPVQFTRASPLALATRNEFPLASLEPGWAGPPAPTTWVVDVFSSWACSYPDTAVREIACAAVGDGFDHGLKPGPSGDPPLRPNPVHVVGSEMVLWSKLMSEVGKGRMAGPFKSMPVDGLISTPLRLILKDKYDLVPNLKRLRVISNFSAGFDSSINSRVWSPELISVHLHGYFLGDLISEAAAGGEPVEGFGFDIPDCFRGQSNLRFWLKLFGYRAQRVGESEPAYFLDLCRPFGFRPSEYEWGCISAVILWEFKRRGLHKVFGYVDNFFRFFRRGAKVAAEKASLLSALKSIGLDVHEVQSGSLIKGLGWYWHLDFPQKIVCPKDKHAHFSAFLAKLCARRPLALSLNEVERVVGFMGWLVTVFRIGKPDVAALVSFKTALSRIAAVRHLSSDKMSMAAPTQVEDGLRFWSSTFASWDRLSPVVASFSPITSWQMFGRVDAWSKFGCGGVFLHGRSLLAFTHEWSEAETGAAFVTSDISTGVFEAMGLSHWFACFGKQCAESRLQLEMDNSAVVQAVLKGFSDRPEMRKSIYAVRRSCAKYFINLRIVHVLRAFNTVADALSRNDIQKAQCLAWKEFGMQLVLVPYRAIQH